MELNEIFRMGNGLKSIENNISDVNSLLRDNPDNINLQN